MQDIEFEIYFDNTEKWNNWLQVEFIDHIRNLFQTDNINLNDIYSVRWQIFREYDVYFSPYKCTIKIVENYDPAQNIYNDPDFVVTTMVFHFSQLDGNIPTMEVSEYYEIYEKINSLYKEILLPIGKQHQ